jgi:hypothetical protein
LTTPFLTTVSSCADVSDTSMAEPCNLLWNLFRRLAWVEGDGDDLLGEIAAVSAGLTVTGDVRALTALMNPLLSMQLAW